MAFILSIETSTSVCSVAVHREGSIVALSQYFVEKSHSSILTPLIEETLQHSGIKIEDLSAVAISEGPGSYTGLRIGTSTAKGICFALDIPLIAVNTLLSMAHEVNLFNQNKALLCPMLDARRMEVYSLVTDADLNIIQETLPIIIDEESFKATLAGNEVLFFGNGSEKCSSVIRSGNAVFLKEIHPSAKNIGALAWKAFEQKSFVDLAYFEPFYLKPFLAGKPKQLV